MDGYCICLSEKRRNIPIISGVTFADRCRTLEGFSSIVFSWDSSPNRSAQLRAPFLRRQPDIISTESGMQREPKPLGGNPLSETRGKSGFCAAEFLELFPKNCVVPFYSKRSPVFKAQYGELRTINSRFHALAIYQLKKSRSPDLAPHRQQWSGSRIFLLVSPRCKRSSCITSNLLYFILRFCSPRLMRVGDDPPLPA
jgi:hypothetical protein